MTAKPGDIKDKSVVPAQRQVMIGCNNTGNMVDILGTDDRDSKGCARAAVHLIEEALRTPRVNLKVIVMIVPVDHHVHSQWRV